MSERQDPVLLESKLIQSSVFSESAHVTRRGDTSLPEGLSRLALDGLPQNLDPALLRVSTSLGTVRSIEMDRVLLQKKEDGSKTPEEEIEKLQQEVYRLTGELEALQSELKLIDRVTPAAPNEGGGPLRPDVFLSGLDTLIKRRRDTQYAIRVAAYELELAQGRLSVAQRHEAATSDGADDLFESMLVVNLETDRAGECAIDIIYEAARATWRPYYNLRLNGEEQTIEVIRFADIWQTTGEDWESVSLRLSTAEPERGLLLPRVLPWVLEAQKSFEDRASQLYANKKKPVPRAPSMEMEDTIHPKAGKERERVERRRASLEEPLLHADTDAFEEATGDIFLGEDEHDPVTIPGVPAEEFDRYAQQFEEEGIFAEVTSSGLDAMYVQRESDGPGTARSQQPLDPPPPPAPPPPPSNRGLPSGLPEWNSLIRYAPREASLPRDLSGGISYEFEVPGASSCRSGKDHTRLGFGSQTYPARIRYLLRPAVRDHAFGRVSVFNNEPDPLLAGPAAIFVDDAYFGSTKIKTTPSGGKLTLDLGAETSIKSKRRSTTTVRTEGIITKEDIHVVEVTIEVESYLDFAANLEIQDQVPISDDSKVKVRLMKTAPKDADLDELSGVLTFHARIAPGGRTEVSVTYEIEAPKDYHLVQRLKGD